MSGKCIDRTGQRFGRLVAVNRAQSPSSRSPHWLFRCDCGTEKVISVSAVINANSPTRSCGCFRREKARNFGRNFRTHGEAGFNVTPEYQTWLAMRHRCRNPKVPGFKNYGGRGIVVCDRWQTFENFLSDMGRRPDSGFSLDRVDNDGDYEPGNCRWATRLEQAANQRHSNQYLRARDEGMGR